jgi:XTP/dITP diphosphohydrolase
MLLQLYKVDDMKLVLASGNRGKLREFRSFFGETLVSAWDLMEPFDIDENADTFAGNALIKAKAIYEKLGEGYTVISDDSGISVPLLGGEPGIYSARYAGEDADERDNLLKLVAEIRKRGGSRTPAHYTAAIAIVSNLSEYVVHGWMYGDVIDEERGDGGFGYDPIFIPEGYDRTLGELDSEIKAEISHRSKAVSLASGVLDILGRYE